MKYFVMLATVLILSIGISCSSLKERVAPQSAQAERGFSFSQKLPQDTSVIKGKLANGMTYYIRHNVKPENRVELRLVVNAGSILEDDDQQGLAHFCEHMAFNGSKHFHKQELVNFLESIGMRFGADLNAYTSFDETVYMLQVPTDSLEILDKAFTVLEDWAHYLSYEDDEIDKERGVVIEEWRLGRGARQRMMDKQLPILLEGSRYAERLPIGKKAVLDTFKHDTPRRFYHEWYRPGLMAVVVVGDMDPKLAKKMIDKHFASIPKKENAKPRKLYPIPDHDKTMFAIASDPEASSTSLSIYYLLPHEKETTVADYRGNILANLYNGMLNRRLQELTQQKDPPFIYAYSDKSGFMRTKEIYYLGSMVKDNGVPRALEALLTEAKRVAQFGFTSTELERVKTSVLRGMEKAYAERNKTESRRIASEYIRNFLNEEPIPGIAYEYKLYQELLPGIKVEEINALANKWMKDNNRVILVSIPQKEGVAIPTEEELQGVIDQVAQKTVTAYKDEVMQQPLLAKKPAAGKVVEEKEIKDLGVTEWTLSNGVHVILKPTQFKNDEVRFTAFSPGGYSLIDNQDLIPAKTAASFVSSCGVGSFNIIQLQKLLTGKVVRVNPYIAELREGMGGSSSPKDIETMFQLIYLYFTAPRKDSTAFLSYQARMKGFYENRLAEPYNVYQDSVTAIYTQHNPRYRPMDVKSIEQMDLEKSFRIYKERFADAGDFTFIFVGNFEPEKIKPLMETYLGSLPSLKRKESGVDRLWEYPKGVVKRTIVKGHEPKSFTTIIFSGPIEWNLENRSLLNTLVGVMRIKLRERLREDLSGVYYVRLQQRARHYPRERYSLFISYGNNPSRVDELSKEVFAQIDTLQRLGAKQEYLDKVKKIALRSFETGLKKNNFWLNQLQFRYYNKLDPESIMQIDDLARERTLEDVKKAANMFLNPKKYIEVVLMPEK